MTGLRADEKTPGGRSQEAPPQAVWLQPRTELALLLLVLVTATTVRLWRLDSIPPGFTHDEAGHGHDAVAILHGARPIYQTVGYGREPLYDYVVAVLMGLFGSSGSTLRFSSVLLGLSTLFLTFAWVRLAFDSPTALVALALQAASFWSLSTSRQALRSGLLPVLFAAAVFFYWRYCRALDRPRHWQLGLVAVLLGATLYTYIPARVLWTVFPAFLVYLALFQRREFRRLWRPTLLAVVVGLLLALPLFVYLRTHPGAEQRLAMLDAPLEALKQGDLSVVLNRVQGAVAGLLLPGYGDDFLAYTIPGRPTFDWLTGALFLIGLGICLARWRKPACAFSLLWFFIGISPSLITGATASSTRSIGALPVAFLFPALAIVAGTRWVMDRWGSLHAFAATTASVGLVLVTGALSTNDYFVTWGESPHVRAAYQHTLVEIAGYLDTRPESAGVALSSIHPHAPHDPYVFEMALRRRDLVAHWFDARRAILIPSTRVTRLFAPSSASLDPYFSNLPGLDLQERVALRSDDLDPFFVLYDWKPEVTLTALRERAAGAPLELGVPVNLSGTLQLLGYDLLTPTVQPGGTVALVTLWQVLEPRTLLTEDLADAAAELVLFTHALDAENSIIGQEDRLDAPTWDWQAGDVIAQLHSFSLPADLAPGSVTLRVGAYRRADLTRLPVLVNGVVVADSVLLRGVEVLNQ